MASVRKLAGSLAVAGIVLALSACNGGTDPDPSASSDPSATSPSSTGPKTLTLTLNVYGSEPAIAAYHQIAADYSAAHPEVTFHIKDFSDAAAAAEGTMAQLEASKGPDLFLLDQEYLPRFVASNHLEPVDALLEDRGTDFGDGYQRTALTAFSANAGLQCMPAEMSPRVVYYNKRLLPQALLEGQGVTLPSGLDSWTWEDFATTARAAVEVHGAQGVKGAYLPPDLESLTAFLRSAGSDSVDAVNDPTTLTLSDDTGLATLTSIATLTHDPTVSLTAREIVAESPLDRFVAGRLAMYVGTRADLPSMLAAKRLRFDVFPLPTFGKAQSTSEVNGFCLNRSSTAIPEAADFLAYAVSDEAAVTAAESNAIVPASLQVLRTVSFTEPEGRQMDANVFITALRRSAPMPSAQAWPEVLAEAGGTLTRVYLDPTFDLQNRLGPVLERLEAKSALLFSGATPTPSPTG